MGDVSRQVSDPRAGPAAFFVLLPTLECNLRCAYCFQERVSGRWDVNRALSVIDMLVAWAVERRLTRLHFHWQGGEPLLLGEPFWRQVLPAARTSAERHGLQLTQAMQTNLTGYHPALKDLVHEFFGDALGSSFELNGGRKYPGPGGIERFRDEWLRAYARCTADGIRVGVLSLVSEQMLEDGAVATLTRLRDELGLRRLRFTLPFKQAGSQAQGYWLDPVDTGRFLADVYRHWRASGRDGWLHIKPLAHLEARLLGNEPEQPGYCEFIPDCTQLSMAVLPSGDVTLCDNFAHPKAMPPYGNLFENDLTTICREERRREVSEQVVALADDTCLQCRYLPVCFGGCLAKSHLDHDGGTRRFHYCESYRVLFETIEESAHVA